MEEIITVQGNSKTIEYPSGRKEWYVDNKLHRDDGPAVIASFYEYWYQNGVQHRDDGPASIRKSVSHNEIFYEWHQHGVMHRTDGPAFIITDYEGNDLVRTWYFNGEIHREDGPAWENIRDDKIAWCLNGKTIPDEAHEWIIKMGFPTMKYCEWTTQQKALFKLKWL